MIVKNVMNVIIVILVVTAQSVMVLEINNIVIKIINYLNQNIIKL